MPTKVTRASRLVVGQAALPPTCGPLYVVDLTNPNAPVCKLAVLQPSIAIPSLGAAFVVSAGLAFLKAPVLAAMGTGFVVGMALVYFFAQKQSGVV